MRRTFLALCALLALAASAAPPVPDLWQQIAARHGVPAGQLYQRALQRSGWVNEYRQQIAWPWTVQMDGRRYQFRDRLAMFNWLADKRGSGQRILFGLDARPLGLQTREQLWAELDVVAMIDRSARLLGAELHPPVQSPLPRLPATGVPVSTALQPLVRQVSRETGVDELLLHAVINQESSGNRWARSPKGAMGLMQLMPDTARSLGLSPAQFYEPYFNLRGGATYLKQQLLDFGSLELALAAYNAGPEAVRRHGGIPPYRETRHYVSRITGRYQALQQAHGRPVTGAVRTPAARRVNAAFLPQTQAVAPAQRSTVRKVPARQRVVIAEKRPTPTKKSRKVRQ